MKIRKYRSKSALQCYEYSISHLSSKEFVFLAYIMANLRFDIPKIDKVGTFSVAYDGFTSIAPATLGPVSLDFRRLFASYGTINGFNLTPQTEIKFDIDDVF